MWGVWSWVGGVALGLPIVAICPIGPVENQSTGKPKMAGKLPKFGSWDTIPPKCFFFQFKAIAM